MECTDLGGLGVPSTLDEYLPISGEGFLWEGIPLEHLSLEYYIFIYIIIKVP